MKGFIKSDKSINPEEREGFIRIDMYKSFDDASKNKLGEAVVMSARAYKTGEWIEEQVSLVAPEDIEYLVISFQKTDFQDGPMSIHMDDVELFESLIEPDESFPLLPYIKPTIPLDGIYYNSFL